MIVTDGKTFTDFESTDMNHSVEYPDKSALIVRQVNTAKSGRYQIVRTTIADPARDVVLIRAELKILHPGPPLKAYVSYDPSLNNSGLHDTGYTQGNVLLAMKASADFAQAKKDEPPPAPAAAPANASISGWSLTGAAGTTPGTVATALIAQPAFVSTSSGFSGVSDGTTELRQNHTLTQHYARARNGNVVQLGELPQSFATGTPVTLALAFAPNTAQALAAGRASLAVPFDRTSAQYAAGWHTYTATLKHPEPQYEDEFLRCAMVLRAHEDKLHPGALVASITNPWGEVTPATKPDNGGYHIVWVRDLYHSATAFMAMGDNATARRALDYLLDVQQKSDGSFPQDSWLTGKPYQSSLQMDEVAFPIVMAWQLGRTDSVTYRKHLKPAAEFILAKGPWTPQERWEEQDGYSPATIAAQIAGLICAADIATKNGDPAAAVRYTATADEWFHKVKGWTVTKTGAYGPEYFLRITQHGKPDAGEKVVLTSDSGTFDEREIVDPSFLELVRMGVMRPDDPTILASLAVTDKILGTQTPTGPGWHRYVHDGYGESADGVSYTGHGIGRIWPFLAGERGEYEIASGHDGRLYLDTMMKQSNDGGMMPEQVWDLPTSPKPSLVFGKPNGSGNPMGWTTGQFIRLAMSVKEHRVVETPSIVLEHFKGMQ